MPSFSAAVTSPLAQVPGGNWRQHESRFVVAGLLLAAALLVLLVMVTGEIVAKAQAQRAASQAQAQQRSRCAALPQWREREICLGSVPMLQAPR